MAKGKNQDPIDVVTGGTSSLGVHLIKELLKRGDEVRVIVKEHPKASTEWRTLPAGCIPYIADLTANDEGTREVLKGACEGANNIFHLAAATYNYKYSYNEMVDTNVIGTENLIRAYTDANPGKDRNVHFIYASSVTVYGYQRPGEVLTEESDTKPASGYSETKLMAEKVIESFATADTRIRYTIMRFGTMYGEGYESSYFKVFGMIKTGKLRYIGPATNHLTLVNVNDAAHAMVLATENPRSFNKVYNITDGIPYTQKELFSKAAQFMKAEAPTKTIHPLLARLGAKTRGVNFDEYEFIISERTVSIERAKRELGYKPTSDIDIEGKELVEQFIKTGMRYQ